MKNSKKIIFILMFIILYFIIFSNISKATTVKVTGDTINVRKGPSTSTDVVAMLSKGVECELIEKDGEWYKIKYKTYTGYVNKEYVKIVGETDTKNETNTEITSNQNETGETTTTNESNKNTENNNSEIVYKKIKKQLALKILPLIYSNEIETLKENTQIILLGETVGWSYIQTQNSCGWVRTEYLENVDTEKNNNKKDENNNTTEEKKAYINETSVNMRKGAGTSYNILKVLTLNTEVTIIEEDGNWYKIKVGTTTGYVLKEYVSNSKTTTTRGNNTNRTETTTTKTTSTKNNKTTKNTTTSTTSVSTSKSQTTSKVKGTDIVAYAKKYLGYKYVYGGDGSNGTFDCSGFTMYVYKHFGFNIPHGANSQYNCGKGTKITNYSDLQIGDIVMLTDYETGVGIGHCGIYLGNDNFIHASTTCNAVEISSFKTIYKNRFYAGLRLI